MVFQSKHDVFGFGTGRFWFILGESVPPKDRNSGPEVDDNFSVLGESVPPADRNSGPEVLPVKLVESTGEILSIMGEIASS